MANIVTLRKFLQETGISKNTVWSWIREGKIHGYKPAKKMTMIDMEEYYTFIKDCGTVPPVITKPQ